MVFFSTQKIIRCDLHYDLIEVWRLPGCNTTAIVYTGS